MSNGRRSAWPSVLAWTAIITIAGTLGLIVISLIGNITGPIEWWKAHVDNTRQLYLLSATAQVLAALFALVFSITLIAVQFVTKYTHRTMRMIFNKKILWYMGGFALAVILPLWFISHPTGWGSLVCLFIGSVYVLSLVGFFHYLHKKLSIDGIIEDLKTEGLAAVGKKEFEKAKKNINALDNIGMGAFTDRNFEVFELAVKTLADFALELEMKIVEIQPQSEEGALLDSVFSNLWNSFDETIESPRAPLIILNQYRRIGIEAVKTDNPNTWIAVGRYIEATEKKSIEESTTPTPRDTILLSAYCGGCLHAMLREFPAKDKIDSNEIGLFLKEIRIHREHINNNWTLALIPQLDNTVELAIKYGLMIEFGIGGIFDKITTNIFEFLDHFVKGEKPENVGKFLTSIGPLIKALGENNNYRKTTSLFIKELGIYGNKCLGKQKKEWWKEGMGLYLSVAQLGSSVLKHDYFDITLSAITTYIPTINHTDQYRSNFTAALGLPQLLTEQTQTLEKKGKLDNQEFVRNIIRALEYGLRIYIEFHLDPFANVIAQKSNKENIVQILWEKISPLTYNLLKQGLEKQWGEVVWQVYFFFRDISTENALNKRPLDQEELLVGIWVSLAAIVAIQEKTKREPPIHDIAQNLHAQYLDEKFYKAYQKTSVLVKKLDIREELAKARSLVNRKRRELGFPTYP